MNEVQRITKRYLQIPKEKRDKLILDDKKKEKIREYDEMPMSRQVNGFSINQLEQLRSKLGSKIEILSEKIQSMDGGGAGMSNEASQKEYPCYNPERASDHEPTTTTTWKNDTATLEPLSYTRPMEVILSDYPPMFFNNAADMMAPMTQPMSSFNFENFCSGGISNESNFTYTGPMDTQMMMMPSTGCREMEIGSLGASPWFLQPSLLQ
ncbi:uncharacterized protein LOC113274038 [Papaver somniferum]|uniref:uncharacterized protein LOC113274038 n=1 Tax=Papaver somniferum TaxID=3469 RepID=UPI000E6F8EB5|nr:uncharacterized protein LOC113274038 [Papaver somniferum]